MKSFIYPRKWVLVRISNFTSLKETIEEISNCIEDNEKHMSLKVIGEEYNFDVDEIEKPHIIVMVPQVQLSRSLNSTNFEKSNIKTL